MPPYEYAPLNYSKNEIRILRFCQPTNSGESTLHCTLQHVSLDDLLPAYQHYLREHKPATPISAIRGWIKAYRAAQSCKPLGVKEIEIEAWRYAAEYAELPNDSNNAPIRFDGRVLIPSRFNWGDFEAISYCWESTVRDKDISVDGKLIRITANLESLLQQLRQLPEALSGIGFWADGLCINQEDVLEKNHQVVLMSRIYSQAMSTIVWLGPPSSSSNTAIDDMLKIYGSYRLRHVETGHDLVYRRGPRISLQPCFLSIIDLFSRRYFKRMWIMQELALNKNMTMFLCGSRHFSRVHLQAMSARLRANAVPIAQNLNSEGRRGHLAQLRHDFIWTTANDVHKLLVMKSNDLDRLFDLAQTAQATDLRDKVYGMLGLLPQNLAAQIEPDYSKTLEEVFIELAASILNCCQRLDELLSWCVFNQTSTLPSWTPNWTTSHKRKRFWCLRGCKAGGGDPLEWSLCERGRRLYLRAVCIGQVQFASLETRCLLAYKDFTPANTSHSQTSRPYGRYCDKEELSKALNRTLMHGHSWKLEEGSLTDLPWIDWSCRDELGYLPTKMSGAWSESFRYFDRFRQSNADFAIFGTAFKDFFADATALDRLIQSHYHGLLEGEELSRQNSCWLGVEPAAAGLQHRRLCTTETGYLCLAPDNLQIGDTVAVVFGCGYPVLLRPCEGGFKYVGECYVDGVMDGEATGAAAQGECEVEDVVLL